jgi:hypothetical protein
MADGKEEPTSPNTVPRSEVAPQDGDRAAAVRRARASASQPIMRCVKGFVPPYHLDRCLVHWRVR